MKSIFIKTVVSKICIMKKLYILLHFFTAWLLLAGLVIADFEAPLKFAWPLFFVGKAVINGAGLLRNVADNRVLTLCYFMLMLVIYIGISIYKASFKSTATNNY